MVRRHLILSIEKMLLQKPNELSYITAYVSVTLHLATDVDPKVVDTVVESFRKNIFDNIGRYELSTSEKQLFPWRLLRAMFCSKDNPDMRTSINNWINKKLLT